MAEHFRASSKRNWIPKDGQEPSLEQINAGSLQRIADATEQMAKNYNQLLNDKEYYERRYKEMQQANIRLYNRIRALQGHLTRHKNKKP